MIPEVEFRYSIVYDEIYRDSTDVNKFLEKIGRRYPSSEEILDFTAKIRKVWKKDGIKILKEISDVSGLKWREDKIVVYVVGECIQISNPLTIKLSRSIDHAIDALTHELIHRIQLSLTDKKLKKWINFVDSKYSKESIITKNHIFVHAVHKEIYLDLFGNKRLEIELRHSERNKDYWRAWEIVEDLGHESIIKKFKEMTID